MRRFIRSLSEKYDDGVETLIVGHSMGGIVGSALVEKLRTTQILGLVTIFSPNTFLFSAYPRMLDAAFTKQIPVVSFKATLDSQVWWGTRHGKAKHHEVLRSWHLRTLVTDPALAKTIAQVTKEQIFSSA